MGSTAAVENHDTFSMQYGILAFGIRFTFRRPISSSISLRAVNKKCNKVFNMTQKAFQFYLYLDSYFFPSFADCNSDYFLFVWSFLQNFFSLLFVESWKHETARDRYWICDVFSRRRKKTQREKQKCLVRNMVDMVERCRSQNIYMQTGIRTLFFPSIDSVSPLLLSLSSLLLLLFHLRCKQKVILTKKSAIEIQS